MIAFTFSHLCVDSSCFYLLTAIFEKHAGNTGMVSVGFLLYNTIAFGLQPFIGYFCDLRRKIPVAPAGCLFLLAGMLMSAIPWAAICVCAVGNACFHVGGGIDSLVNSRGAMSRSGVFVSSGAIGVVLGILAGKSGAIPMAVPAALLFVCFILLIFLTEPAADPQKDVQKRVAVHFQITSGDMPIFLILGLCLCTVAIRSFTGSIVPMEWRTTTVPFLLLLPGIGACIGKVSGGYLADRFGARNTAFVSLALSLPFFLFGHGDPFLCTAGILLFNMTMPVTLCAIADKLPESPGFAFGLTTLGLLCGNIPTFFVRPPEGLALAGITGMILLSVAFMGLTLRNQKGGKQYEKASQTV